MARQLYQGSYRDDLDLPDTPVDNIDNNTVQESPEEKTWKKRYGDLRSHSNTLTDRIRELEAQLNATSKKEIKIPSTPQELEVFAKTYPDVFRNIRSIVLTELMQEKEHIADQTKVVQEDLDKLKRERGMQKILSIHPDFKEINLSQDFHTWADTQPKQIQDWMFESSDPDLCIRGIDLYKADRQVKAERRPARPPRDAAAQVPTRGSNDPDELAGSGNKRIWKATEIAKLHPKQFEVYEAEIMAANREGRILLDQ